MNGPGKKFLKNNFLSKKVFILWVIVVSSTLILKFAFFLPKERANIYIYISFRSGMKSSSYNSVLLIYAYCFSL